MVMHYTADSFMFLPRKRVTELETAFRFLAGEPVYKEMNIETER